MREKNKIFDDLFSFYLLISINQSTETVKERDVRVCSVVPDSFRPHGLQLTRLLCPWDFPGKNTGVGCHFLLQGIFPTQGSNLGLLHRRQTLEHLIPNKASSLNHDREWHFGIVLVQLSCSVVSDSLQLHVQPARLPCPSPTPGCIWSKSLMILPSLLL